MNKEFRLNVDEMETMIKLALMSSTPDLIIQYPNLVDVIMFNFSGFMLDGVSEETKQKGLKLYDELVKLGKQREKLLSDEEE
ncbi:MAG: hypothetical protein Q4E87_01045 [bacterium]|nr:hypothetical protein [bacterium]